MLFRQCCCNVFTTTHLRCYFCNVAATLQNGCATSRCKCNPNATLLQHRVPTGTEINVVSNSATNNAIEENAVEHKVVQCTLSYAGEKGEYIAKEVKGERELKSKLKFFKNFKNLN